MGDLNLIAFLGAILLVVNVKHGSASDVLPVLRMLHAEFDHDLTSLVPQVGFDNPDLSRRALRRLDFHFL